MALLDLSAGADDPGMSNGPEPRQETYFKDLVESAPDSILVVDERGLIELVNRQAEVLFGYPRDELLGQSIDLLVPERARAVHPGHRAGYFADPRTRLMGAGLDLTARRRDGSEVPVDISLSPLETDKGRVVAVAIRDITERKRAETALQEAYAKLSASVDELERHDRDMTLVNEMGDLLQSCITAEEAHQVISRYGRRLFPSDSGAVFVATSERDVLEAAAAWGSPAPTVTTIGREECWALRRARVYSLDGLEDGPFCQHLEEPREQGYICVPMMAQGEAFGLLHLRIGADQAHATHLHESKRRLALTVAEQLSLALANLSLRESLRHQSVSDPVTGLLNRRYAEDHLGREIAHAARAGGSVGIIAIDVDHFKDVNDTLGHGIGDDVLRSVARILGGGVRRGDVVCRFGGDEFVVVLPGSSLEGTRQRAEELQQAVRRASSAPDRALPAVSLSLGVAVFPDHGQTAEAVLRSADVALYQAKQAGRDRVAASGQAGGVPAPNQSGGPKGISALVDGR